MDVDSDCLRDGELSSALHVAALLLLCLLLGTRAYSGVSTQNEKAEEEVVCLQISQPPALKHLNKNILQRQRKAYRVNGNWMFFLPSEGALPGNRISRVTRNN